MRTVSLSCTAAALCLCGIITGCGPEEQPIEDASADAESICVAVAANFAATMQDLTQRYEADTGRRIDISAGSTGALYSQIEHGAPFDLFFAADTRRPTMLEENGLAVDGTRRTYAQGSLVLWSADTDLITDLEVLRGDDYQHLAIANPITAPYGLAAQQTLERSGLWETVLPRMVRAQSIGQAHQFVSGGSAQLGFVALSQIQQPGTAAVGSRLLIDPTLYDPIEQQVVMLTDSQAARDFWAWVTESETARETIRLYGYLLTDPEDGS